MAAALRGRSGVSELETSHGNDFSAYAPVPKLGWTVRASVPTKTAFAGVGRLRSAVLTIAAILGLVLLGALVMLIRGLAGRRRAEEEIRRQAMVNKTVVEATTDGIALVDLEGNYLVRNSAMDDVRSAFGGSDEETLYERADAVSDRAADPEAMRVVMRKAAEDPEYEATEEFRVAASGQTFQIYTGPIRNAAGIPTSRIFTARDVTSDREAERMKTELVATVSHELRTPLASILGFAELLSTRTVDDDTRARYLSTINSEARRLTNLINDFLDLQRIEEGSFTLSLEPIDLAQIIREQASVYAEQSEAHTIELELPDESLTVLGEGERIAQVIANLISNAIKYSPGGCTVTVRAESRGGAARVSVSDTGLGIPADQQRKLFMKFFRVDTSDTREIGGTGLGLALSREIVEAHGGRIAFDSVQGRGSTFWFELPSVSQTSAPKEDYVLVIEDDPAAASLLSEYLTVDGYAVEVAASCEQALRLVDTASPLLVCLDIQLSGEDSGWEILSHLKARPATAGVPVIVCTGRNGRRQAAALGAADFVTKPFSQERIRDAVRRVLPEGRGSVLVVDDEDNVRRLVRETLRGDGIVVHEADDGDIALEQIADHKPDAIVLDLMMPKLDGFAVLERLQDDPETRLTPVIVLTARQLSAEEKQRLQSRAVALLHKSAYSPEELRRLVASALGARA